MKPCFDRVAWIALCICAVTFCFASAATPPEENAPPTPSQQRSQANQPNKTKNKQNTNSKAALNKNQSKNSQSLQSNGPRKDVNSPRQVESRRSERRQEKADIA